jgi:hypothetical protein
MMLSLLANSHSIVGWMLVSSVLLSFDPYRHRHVGAYSLLVGNTRSDSVSEISENGTLINPRVFSIPNPDHLLMYQDKLYVSSGDDFETSGIFMLNNLNEEPVLFASGGGLVRPYGFTFYEDTLYVASFKTDQILMYSALDGSYQGVFADKNDTFCNGPNHVSAHEGKLYVTTQGSNVVNGTPEYLFTRYMLFAVGWCHCDGSSYCILFYHAPCSLQCEVKFSCTIWKLTKDQYSQNQLLKRMAWAMSVCWLALCIAPRKRTTHALWLRRILLVDSASSTCREAWFMPSVQPILLVPPQAPCPLDWMVWYMFPASLTRQLLVSSCVLSSPRAHQCRWKGWKAPYLSRMTLWFAPLEFWFSKTRQPKLELKGSPRRHLQLRAQQLLLPLLARQPKLQLQLQRHRLLDLDQRFVPSCPFWSQPSWGDRYDTLTIHLELVFLNVTNTDFERYVRN